MKKLKWFLFTLVLISCNPSVKKTDLGKLNGYWEIQKVELANGEKKDYKVNETIDFFELKNNQGFRQKVMPQFDGRFKTNGIKENIKVIEKEDAFYIEYKTKYGSWKEQIIALKDSSLILKSKENLTYIYKRFTPFSLK